MFAQEEKTRLLAVRLLLSRGADVNARDDTGRTAFSYASEMHCNDVVQLLIRNNVDPDVPDNNGQSHFITSRHSSAEAAGSSFSWVNHRDTSCVVYSIITAVIYDRKQTKYVKPHSVRGGPKIDTFLVAIRVTFLVGCIEYVQFYIRLFYGWITFFDSQFACEETVLGVPHIENVFK